MFFHTTGDAVFDATVKLTGKKMTVLGNPSRINLYGYQSYCTEDGILKLYCYCTDLL